MASPQAEALFQAALQFAKLMLSKAGAFHPFGVSLDPSGKVAMVGGDVGSEHPDSAELIALLQSSFAELARQGSIQAAGVCLDCRVVPPGSTDKSDAICIRLATVAGEAIEVFVPYRKPLLGGHKYGSVFATPGQAFVLSAA